MIAETLTLHELKERSLHEILQDVVDRQSGVVVVMRDGTKVIIEAKPRLKPLPVLKGYVPEGSKGAVYG